MRGSSDLESVWESRLTFKRDGESGLVTIKAEHREEEPSDPISYRLDWHHDTRTMRLRPSVPPLAERIIDHLREHGPSGGEAIAKSPRNTPPVGRPGTRANGGPRDDTPCPVRKTGRDGTTHPREGLASQQPSGFVPRPGTRTGWDVPSGDASRPGAASRPFRGGRGTGTSPRADTRG